MQKTALISVYHKDGIENFAKELAALGWRILASGGTAQKLKESGIKAKDVAELAGEPILGHRVVTLSREIHAGLLARDTKADNAELQKIKVPRIDLVCVDLYPLENEIKKKNSTKKSVIEQTDIGGPTMLRSAAKGGRIVICDPADRTKVIEWLKAKEPNQEEFLSGLRAKAEKIVAEYALLSANYHSNGFYGGIIGECKANCKYGENPDQAPAFFYKTPNNDSLALDKFQMAAGSSPSYNNFTDIDRMLQTITHIASAQESGIKIALGAKHGNPCGAGINSAPQKALEQMLMGDPRAIFGGFAMVNFKIGEAEAKTLLEYKQEKGRRILDGVIAPSFSPKAIEMLARKEGRAKLLFNPALQKLSQKNLDKSQRFRYARGGFLTQPNYTFVLNLRDKNIEKTKKASAKIEKDMALAWAIGATSNSNTVTIVKNGQLLGNGVGQQDRVGGCELAIKRASDSGHSAKGSVAYSDSFFPFVDGVETLAKAGVKAILAYSGSIRDEEVKAYCKKNKISLYLIPADMGRGFFGH